MSTHSARPYAHPAWMILVLSIAPAVGLGICRFGYALVLPDMRDSLGWTYSMAGSMNTVNAAGYLFGALAANAIIRRFGAGISIKASAAACVLSLAMSALSGDFLVFGTARLMSGFAASLAFIAGGAVAANVAEAQPDRKAFYLALFYVGPAAGILISGFVSPPILALIGPGSWRLVWGALALISLAMSLLLLGLALPDSPSTTFGSDSDVRATRFPLYLIGYALFGAGYIAYMTFMVAYVRNEGGGTWVQWGFWTLVGIGAFAQPWVWGKAMASAASGRLTALLIALTAVGAMIPLMGRSLWLLSASAAIFGNAFFAVVSSTTAFSRLNFPAQAWPRTIALMTIAFGVGQICGPVLTGAITDAAGHLSYGLSMSAALLVLGAAACLIHASMRQEVSPGDSGPETFSPPNGWSA